MLTEYVWMFKKCSLFDTPIVLCSIVLAKMLYFYKENLQIWSLIACFIFQIIRVGNQLFINYTLWLIYSNNNSTINTFSTYCVYLDNLMWLFWQLSFAIQECLTWNEHTFFLPRVLGLFRVVSLILALSSPGYCSNWSVYFVK